MVLIDKKLSTIDPVCGLEVIPSGKIPSEVIKGHTYYFCTEKCRNTFNAEPSKYIDILNYLKSDKAWWQNYMHEN